MAKDIAQIAAEEHAVLVTGLIDALMALYPDLNHQGEDDAFLAVLGQAHQAAHQLRQHIHKVNNGDMITPLTVIR